MTNYAPFSLYHAMEPDELTAALIRTLFLGFKLNTWARADYPGLFLNYPVGRIKIFLITGENFRVTGRLVSVDPSVILMEPVIESCVARLTGFVRRPRANFTKESCCIIIHEAEPFRDFHLTYAFSSGRGIISCVS